MTHSEMADLAAGGRTFDERFSADAFAAAGLDTEEARALADDLQTAISRVIHEAVHPRMRSIIERLNIMGHDLRPQYPPEPGDISYRDDGYLDTGDYYCRLRVDFDGVASAGYAHLVTRERHDASTGTAEHEPGHEPAWSEGEEPVGPRWTAPGPDRPGGTSASRTIDEHFSAGAFTAAGLDTEEARALADDLARVIGRDLSALSDAWLRRVVERLNATGHRLRLYASSGLGETAYRDDEHGDQGYRCRLRVAYDCFVVTGYAHLIDPDDDEGPDLQEP